MVKQVELRKRYPAPREAVWQHTFATPHFKKTAHEERGDSDVEVFQWGPIQEGEYTHARDVKFQSPINAPEVITSKFGKTTGGEEVQKYGFNPKQGYSVKTNISLKVPYGDKFRLEGQWKVQDVPGAAKESEITIMMEMEYNGPFAFMIKGLVESLMAKQTAASLEQWLDLAHSSLPPYTEAATSTERVKDVVKESKLHLSCRQSREYPLLSVARGKVVLAPAWIIWVGPAVLAAAAGVPKLLQMFS